MSDQMAQVCFMLFIPYNLSLVVEEVTEMDPHPYLMTLEHICIVWFIFEYTIKMTVTPNHCRTFCQILNIIDLLAILPFLVEMSLWLIGIDTEQLQDIKVS
jgi:hypothetical protein